MSTNLRSLRFSTWGWQLNKLACLFVSFCHIEALWWSGPERSEAPSYEPTLNNGRPHPWVLIGQQDPSQLLVAEAALTSQSTLLPDGSRHWAKDHSDWGRRCESNGVWIQTGGFLLTPPRVSCHTFFISPSSVVIEHVAGGFPCQLFLKHAPLPSMVHSVMAPP